MRLIAFDLDDTLCPTGSTLPVEYIRLMDVTPPDRIKTVAPQIAYAPFPAARDLVKRLHGEGRTLAVVTNGRGTRQRNKLVLSGLDAYFAPERVLASEEQAWKLYRERRGRTLQAWERCISDVEKPSPYLLEKLTRETGIPESESLYVGDRDVDRLAAWAAGWQFYHVKGEDSLKRLDGQL